MIYHVSCGIVEVLHAHHDSLRIGRGKVRRVDGYTLILQLLDAQPIVDAYADISLPGTVLQQFSPSMTRAAHPGSTKGKDKNGLRSRLHISCIAKDVHLQLLAIFLSEDDSVLLYVLLFRLAVAGGNEKASRQQHHQ